MLLLELEVVLLEVVLLEVVLLEVVHLEEVLQCLQRLLLLCHHNKHLQQPKETGVIWLDF